MGDRHISNVALSLIGKLRISWMEAQMLYQDVDNLSPQVLYASQNTEIRSELRKMKPETLGKIAAQGLSDSDPRTKRLPRPSGVTDEGKTSMYAVHCGNFVGKYESGRDMLVELAVTAIVAEMTDILREKMHRDASREAMTSEEM
ncbi:MAG: hypothetical protein ABL917_02190 [Parcubacteria group bacterium]